jgi:hypothetical protein
MTTGRFAKGMLSSRRGFVKAAQEQVEILAAQVDTGRLALILQVRDDRNVLTRLRDELQRYKAEIASGFPEADPISMERTA